VYAHALRPVHRFVIIHPDLFEAGSWLGGLQRSQQTQAAKEENQLIHLIVIKGLSNAMESYKIAGVRRRRKIEDNSSVSVFRKLNHK
jgi:hypothetical protein